MILLCGGEGAAGVKTGGAFFLLISYAGRDGQGGDPGVEDASRLRAHRTLVAGDPPDLSLAWRAPSRRLDR
jgi:hypothetical protein